MHANLILIFAVSIPLTLVSTRVPPTNQACEDATLELCANQFADSLGMQGMPSHAQTLVEFVQSKILKEGKAAFQETCSAYKDFQKCLGKELEACITVQALTDIALLPYVDAVTYVAIYYQLDDECGKDYQVMLDHIDCIIKTSVAENSTIMQCSTDFVQNVTKKPEKLCEYLQDLLFCITDVFEKPCGKATAEAMCSAVIATYKVTAKQCYDKMHCKQKNATKTKLINHSYASLKNMLDFNRGMIANVISNYDRNNSKT